MKLHRPYIPLSVRLLVAERMIMEKNPGLLEVIYPDETKRISSKLQMCLHYLFAPGQRIELDHRPALTNRKYLPAIKKYRPDANDPNFLIYRTKENHDEKTRMRGDGAQLSDLGLRRKLKRIERKRKKKWKPRKPKVLR